MRGHCNTVMHCKLQAFCVLPGIAEVSRHATRLCKCGNMINLSFVFMQLPGDYK